jgi:murein L,D-transpeptidase YcbB/YkuD
MHDTPEKALFSKDIRAFSHGCIRLHRPIDMLKTFSEMDHKVNFEKAQEILKDTKKTPVRLSKSVPIDIIYISAWADKEGEVQFREDIYGYDELHMQTAKWLPSAKEEITASSDMNSTKT